MLSIRPWRSPSPPPFASSIVAAVRSSPPAITVLDVFFYLHRGHDFDFIRQGMPCLSREEFDVIAEYVSQHSDELVEKDRQAEEFIRRGIEDQKARGLLRHDESIPLEDRVTRLKQLAQQRQAEREPGIATIFRRAGSVSDRSEASTTLRGFSNRQHQCSVAHAPGSPSGLALPLRRVTLGSCKRSTSPRTSSLAPSASWAR